jgi:toxin YoeB
LTAPARTLAWTAEAWEDYLYWQTQDRKTLKRINALVDDILRDDPFEGIGKPEPLKHALAGAWSRRIDEANRLVYVADDRYVTILQVRYHY